MRTSEPPGLGGLRKQLTEAERGLAETVRGVSPGWAVPACYSPGGPGSLGERKQRYTHLRQEAGRRYRHAPGRVSTGSFVLKVFTCFLKAEILGEFSGEEPNRILINFPGVSFNTLFPQNECTEGSGSFSGQFVSPSRNVTKKGQGLRSISPNMAWKVQTICS